MKRFATCILFAFALLLTALPSHAAKPDPSTRALLAGSKRHAPAAHASRADAGEDLQDDEEEEPPYIPMIMQVGDQLAVDSLRSMGVIVWRQRDDLLLASVPRDTVDSATALSGVWNVAASLPACAAMDVARPYCNVEAAQDYWRIQSPPQVLPLDGSGVLVGFSDIGFDANHIAFKGRVSSFSSYDAAQGQGLRLEFPDEIAEYGTDDPDSYHATHVANILAGGCKETPYYGVAYGAEIAAATSKLQSVGILCGVEDIINKAKEKGVRTVINMSLSHSLGPHDGTDLLCQYLAKCAEDAVICVSAGNSGKNAVSASWDFEKDGEEVSTIVNNASTWDGFELEGMTEFWSLDSRPLALQIEVFDKQERKAVFKSPWIGASCELDTLAINGDDFPEWAQWMQGEVEAAAGLCDLNNRYCVSVYYNFSTQEQWDKGPWARYYLCFNIKAEAGTQMHVFCDSSTFLGDVADRPYINPNADMSINDMATARNVISVGACSTRNYAPGIDGDDFCGSFPLDRVAQFSSYGLGYPLFCAPGNHVVSAISGPYMEAHPEEKALCVLECDGNKHYWINECGTSMASPFAAGVIALWLQANPALTTADIIEIATSTARRDFDDISDPRWGAGCIDAVAGLKKAMSMLASVPSIDANAPIILISPDRRIEISAPASPRRVLITTPCGQCVDPAAPLAPGIYIVAIDAFPPKKIIIR